MPSATYEVKFLSNFSQFNINPLLSGLGQLETTLQRVGTLSFGDKLALGITGTLIPAIAKIGIEATQAAIQFEQAFVSVAKVVEGTTAELGALKRELGEITTELPVSFGEATAAAAVAGQAGVPVGSIGSVAETALQLGIASNLSPEAAARLIAQFSLAQGADPGALGPNLGAALTQAGNTAPTTESEIGTVLGRITGTSSLVGLSPAFQVGLATTIGSLPGVRAEAGSSAFNNILTAMLQPDQNEEYARLIGMSGNEFRTALINDPDGTMTRWFEALGALNPLARADFIESTPAGGSIRQTALLSQLSLFTPLLGEQLTGAESQFENPTALVEESGKAAETAAARIERFGNSVTLALADLGEGMLPVVVGGVDALIAAAGGLADSGFAELIGAIVESIKGAAPSFLPLVEMLGELGTFTFDGLSGLAGMLADIVGIINSIPFGSEALTTLLTLGALAVGARGVGALSTVVGGGGGLLGAVGGGLVGGVPGTLIGGIMGQMLGAGGGAAAASSGGKIIGIGGPAPGASAAGAASGGLFSRLSASASGATLGGVASAVGKVALPAAVIGGIFTLASGPGRHEAAAAEYAAAYRKQQEGDIFAILDALEAEKDRFMRETIPQGVNARDLDDANFLQRGIQASISVGQQVFDAIPFVEVTSIAEQQAMADGLREEGEAAALAWREARDARIAVGKAAFEFFELESAPALAAEVEEAFGIEGLLEQITSPRIVHPALEFGPVEGSATIIEEVPDLKPLFLDGLRRELAERGLTGLGVDESMGLAESDVMAIFGGLTEHIQGAILGEVERVDLGGTFESIAIKMKEALAGGLSSFDASLIAEFGLELGMEINAMFDSIFESVASFDLGETFADTFANVQGAQQAMRQAAADMALVFAAGFRDEYIQAVRTLGPEAGKELVAQLAEGIRNGDLEQVAEVLRAAGAEGVEAYVEGAENAAQTLADLAEQFGSDFAIQVAEGIAAGRISPDEFMDLIGLAEAYEEGTASLEDVEVFLTAIDDATPLMIAVANAAAAMDGQQATIVLAVVPQLDFAAMVFRTAQAGLTKIPGFGGLANIMGAAAGAFTDISVGISTGRSTFFNPFGAGAGPAAASPSGGSGSGAGGGGGGDAQEDIEAAARESAEQHAEWWSDMYRTHLDMVFQGVFEGEALDLHVDELFDSIDDQLDADELQDVVEGFGEDFQNLMGDVFADRLTIGPDLAAELTSQVEVLREAGLGDAMADAIIADIERAQIPVRIRETFADIQAAFLSAIPDLGEAIADAWTELEDGTRVFDISAVGTGFLEMANDYRDMWATIAQLTEMGLFHVAEIVAQGGPEVAKQAQEMIDSGDVVPLAEIERDINEAVDIIETATADADVALSLDIVEIADGVTEAEFLLLGFSEETWEATLEADADGVEVGVLVAQASAGEWTEGEYLAELDARSDGVILEVALAKIEAGTFTEEDWTAVLEADSAGVELEVAVALFEAGIWTEADLTAFLEADGTGAITVIDFTTTSGRTYADDDYDATMDATDEASPVIAVPQGSATTYAGGTYNPPIKATDEASGPIGTVQGVANAYVNGGPYDSIVTAIVNGLQAARDLLSTVLALGRAPDTSSRHTVTTYYEQVGSQSAPTVMVNPGINADGGLYPAADGLIAPGGYPNLYQWAEPETGGEAFIPLGTNKRPRSTQILGQVATQFGFDLIRQGSGLGGGGATTVINAPVNVTVDAELGVDSRRLQREVERTVDRSMGDLVREVALERNAR